MSENFVLGKHRIHGNKKSALYALALILILAFSIFAATNSSLKVQAQTTNSVYPTYAFIAVAPNPVGVNQHVLVDFWLSDPTANSAGGHGGDRYSGFQVVITFPDGTTQTMGPYTASDEAAAYFSFTPTETGTYTFQFNYPGQTFTDIGVTYAASNATFKLTVQQQPVQGVQMSLPTSYWTYPINAMNYAWSSVSGNWLMYSWNSTTLDSGNPSAYDPEGKVPTSAHILWTKPITFGGLAGGQFGTAQYYDGRSYEEFFKPPVIISNHLYYNTIAAEEPVTNENFSSVTCVDLNTGETLFTIPNAWVSFGQIYNYRSPNQAGTFAYLWSSPGQAGRSWISGGTWKMYDAWTGQYILSISHVPSGAVVYEPDGSIAVYSLGYNNTAQTYQLTLWNSTLAIQPNIDTSWEWRPYTYLGQTIDGSNGIQWQVNEPNVTGQILYTWNQGGFFDGNILLTEIPLGGFIGSIFPTNTTSDNTVQFMAYNMTNGAFLWKSTLHSPTGLPNDLNGIDSFEMEWEYNGIFFNYVKQTMQWVAYNVTTGKVMWISQPYTNPWEMYNQAGGEVDVNGVFYTGSFYGTVDAYNDTTGQQLWNNYIGDSGTLTPYGTWNLYNGILLADNTVVATTGEHGNGVEPLYQGEKMYAIDATTGNLSWSMLGWFQQPALASGILLSLNCYDNQIYAFGKGPSATTVTAATGLGNTITLQGSVVDQSAGAKQLVQEGLFNSVPAVSDNSMSAWMAYLYEQQPMPTNATGVPVTLSVVDPNHNTYVIGTTTSDASGTYGFQYIPPVPGLYKVTATFAGTNSYYGSSATTYFTVSATTSSASAAPVASPSPAPTSAAPSTSASAPTASPTTTAPPTASPSPAPAPSLGLSLETNIIAAAVASIAIIVVAAAVAVLRRRRTK